MTTQVTAKSSLDRLKPVTRSKLYLQVCDRLRDYLPKLGPGTWLQEVELCNILGVSRTPIREALIKLSSEGLVELMPNGRCHVPMLDRRDLEEMFDIRIALEGIAARSLCQKITPGELNELDDLAQRADRAKARSSERTAWDDAEQLFHARFIQMADNRRIAKILQRQGLLVRCLRLPIPDWRQLASTDAAVTHEDLVRALRSGDPELAERTFRKHVERRKLWILQHIEQQELEQQEQQTKEERG